MNLSAPRDGDTDDADPTLDEPLLDAKDAAALLTVRPSWVYEAVRAGTLPHYKIGKHIRFVRTDLARWLLEHRQGG